MKDVYWDSMDHSRVAKLNFGETVLLYGSCFSDNMAPLFENAGFRTESNHLGTIYHPLAIAEAFNDALDGAKEHRIFNRDDVWLDWRASSTVYAMSEKAIHERMDTAISDLKKSLEESKVLVITLGTAWGYFLESGEIVGNCHKMPSNTFEKRLTKVEEIKAVWMPLIQRLKERNPEVSIFFTVSPVPHRDGMVKNSRSKAVLLETCLQLAEEMEVEYFPAFELAQWTMQDNLKDLQGDVGINQKCIDKIWQQTLGFLTSTDLFMETVEVENVNRMRKHRSLQPESKAAKDFEESVQQKMKTLSEKHPNIYWKKKEG